MEKLKLMAIIGTRPEIIRLSSCLKVFDKYFNHILVHTGQNWAKTLNEIFFEELGLRSPDYTLSCAGNRCFDLNVPEEINRGIVEHVSDINLAYTEHARRYLLSEGLQKEHIFVTGSPMTEVLKNYEDKINSSTILESLDLLPNKYMLVSAHREENIDKKYNFMTLMKAINTIAQTHQMPVIFSVHPRSKKQIEQYNFKFDSLVKCMEPFGFLDYCKLQKHSFCVLSDSGTLSEESSILGFNGVLLRTSTERPEALDKGSIVIAGTNKNDILQAIDLSTNMRVNIELTAPVPDYLDINVSSKVTKIIQSYTKIVNEKIWRKEFDYDGRTDK